MIKYNNNNYYYYTLLYLVDYCYDNICKNFNLMILFSV